MKLLVELDMTCVVHPHKPQISLTLFTKEGNNTYLFGDNANDRFMTTDLTPIMIERFIHSQYDIIVRKVPSVKKNQFSWIGHIHSNSTLAELLS